MFTKYRLVVDRCFSFTTKFLKLFLQISNISVASCSSDTTIKLWNISKDHIQSQNEHEQNLNQTRKPIETLEGHNDYVSCLSYIKSLNILCSAGLDKKVVLWDLEYQNKAIRELKDEKKEDSIESIMNSNRTLNLGLNI